MTGVFEVFRMGMDIGIIARIPGHAWADSSHTPVRDCNDRSFLCCFLAEKISFFLEHQPHKTMVVPICTSGIIAQHRTHNMAPSYFLAERAWQHYSRNDQNFLHCHVARWYKLGGDRGIVTGDIWAGMRVAGTPHSHKKKGKWGSYAWSPSNSITPMKGCWNQCPCSSTLCSMRVTRNVLGCSKQDKQRQKTSGMQWGLLHS